MSSNAKINAAYALWAERLVREGWTPYLITFMFRSLCGPRDEVARAMEREVERIYATLLSRIVRNPTRPSMMGKLPVWICALDLPVFKRAKQSLRDVIANDGLHVHAVVLLPPWSRLLGDLDAHFEAHQPLYLRPQFPLLRIDVVPITHRAGHVVRYILKSTGRSRLGQDAGFVLPRALSEIRDRAA